jgi:DNA modification methylase
MRLDILNANAHHIPLAAETVQCCITSPPYWGLRDYGVKRQIGNEATPEAYTENIVAVCREIWRVLKPDGVFWLNLGDSYQSSNRPQVTQSRDRYTSRSGVDSLKPKNLVGIPWRVAFALQTDGWYLRQDIIWHKPNSMPESVKDRCTRAHEYVFLLSKSARYFFDSKAIRVPAAYDGRKDMVMKGSDKYRGGFVPNQPEQSFHARGHKRWQIDENGNKLRNKRSVWKVATRPYKGAHFAPSRRS